MAKSPEAFRTISEVSTWLDTPAHVLRFWESRFSQIKPVKRAGGRRYYRPHDMMLLGGIRRLLHDEGITIKGVQKILREQGVKHVSGLAVETFDTQSQAAENAATELVADPAIDADTKDSTETNTEAAAITADTNADDRQKSPPDEAALPDHEPDDDSGALGDSDVDTDSATDGHMVAPAPDTGLGTAPQWAASIASLRDAANLDDTTDAPLPSDQITATTPAPLPEIQAPDPVPAGDNDDDTAVLDRPVKTDLEPAAPEIDTSDTQYIARIVALYSRLAALRERVAASMADN